MKKIGFILIVLGSLAASYAAVQDTREISWKIFVPLVVLAALGVVIVRSQTKAAAEHADTVQSNIDDIERSLSSLAAKVTQLNREKETINTYDMRHKIDEMLLDDLDTFTEARETISVRYGLNAYADVMSHFAAGERYLNRVWSCSADGYIDEVNIYIAKAEFQFNSTLKQFQALRTSE